MWYNEHIYCTKYCGTYIFTILFYSSDQNIQLLLLHYLWSQKNIQNEHRIKCPLQRHKLCFGCQEELYLRCIMTQRDVRSSARLHSKAHYLPFHKDEQQHKHLQNDRRVQSTYYTLKYNSDTGNTGLKVTELPIQTVFLGIIGAK